MISEIPVSAQPAQTFYLPLGDYELVISLLWRQERIYADIDVAIVVIG
jgi:hypothetical protein